MGTKAKKSTRKYMQKKSAGKQTYSKKPKDWKRKSEKARSAADDGDDEPGTVPASVAELDVDAFLAGDFLSSGGGQPGGASSEEEEGGSEGSSDDDGSLGGSDMEDDNAAADGAEELSSADDEGSDDDGGAAGGEVGAQNARLKDEISAHRLQLEKLREADPEFYEYLAATDKELLAFGQGEGDEEEEEEEGEEAEGSEEEEEAEAGKKRPKAGAKAVAAEEAADAPAHGVVTLAMVELWCTAALGQASIGAMRSLLRAYRTACHYGDSESQVEEGMRLGSSAVYNRLMLFVLREADGVFRRILGTENQDLDAAAMTRLPRWKKIDPLVKSYIGNTLHLLGQMTDSAMLAFILRRLRSSTPFFAPYAKLQRRLLKAALTVFASADDAPRVQAILLVRSMALNLGPSSMEACLKGVYRAFSANAKFVNAASAPHINFMAACVVEMYGLDPAASYQHAFGFIRQLALLLRQALTSKSKEAYREVYCWQTINCLELWAKVLAAHADDSPDLRPLVYPAVQLLLGAARLVPTPGYFPLRLRCARALNRLAQATGVYVPVAPLVLEVLQWGDLSKAPKSAPGDRPPEILLQLRTAKSAARSTGYQEEIVETALELLADHLAQWGCHVAFPELAHLPLTQLRRFSRTTPVERFRRSARQLADAIERNISWVGQARDRVDFSPKDLAQVAAFMAEEAAAGRAPVAQHAATLRERARARLAARSAGEVSIGAELPGTHAAGLAGRAKAGDEEDGDEEGLEPSKAARKSKKDRLREAKAAAKAAEKAEAGGDEDEEEALANGLQGAGDAFASDDEDELGEYELSSDEEEQQQRQQPKKAVAGSGAKRNAGPRQQGGQKRKGDFNKGPARGRGDKKKQRGGRK